MRYHWLHSLIASVASPKFFVHGLCSRDPCSRLEDLARRSGVRSYADFMQEFGGVQLFRNGRSYRLEVYSAPRGLLHEHLGPMWWVGRFEATRACIAESESVGRSEARVWEWNYATRWKRTPWTFQEWVESKCTRATKMYRKSEWAALSNGPSPFTPREKAIAAARALYSWSVVGVDDSADLIEIRVSNGSTIALDYISVDVIGRMRETEELLEGGIVIPAGQVAPGQSTIIGVDCYRSLIDPRTAVLSDVPPLGPEDRGILWEFRSLSE